MENILELSRLINYRPEEKGYGSELLGLVEAGHGRNEAMQEWLASGRTEVSFRQALKKLKDRFIKESFEGDAEMSVAQRQRVMCWERHKTVKCLLLADRRLAAAFLAIETIPIAKKCGLTEIVLSLSIGLEYFFGILSPDKRRYQRYRKIRKESSEIIKLEQTTLLLYVQLIIYAYSKKDWRVLKPEIEELTKTNSLSIKFIANKCNVLVAWHELFGETEKMADVIIEAIQSIKNSTDILPIIAIINRYLQLLPILIAQKKFTEAENYLTESLGLPDEGSYTWHQLLLQKAYLGFHSGKPKMALAAWQQASKHKKHSTPLIDERWYIVRAYLAIYEKLGHLAVDGKPFRLARFLNSVRFASQEKKGDNVAILIVQMLHYLLDGKKKDYMHRADNVSNYMAHNLRGKEHIRCRCMLYMLKKVEEGDYYRLRSELRAKKWRRLLGKNPPTMSSEREILPYEMIWELVLGQLK